MSTLWTYVLRVYTIYLQIDCVVLSRSLSLKPVHFCIFVFLYFCIFVYFPNPLLCPVRLDSLTTSAHHLSPPFSPIWRGLDPSFSTFSCQFSPPYHLPSSISTFFTHLQHEILTSCSKISRIHLFSGDQNLEQLVFHIKGYIWLLIVGNPLMAGWMYLVDRTTQLIQDKCTRKQANLLKVTSPAMP